MTYSKNSQFDKFYTPDDVALELTKKAIEHIPDWQSKTFVEPAAGGGAFLRAFEAVGIAEVLDEYYADPVATMAKVEALTGVKPTI